MVFLPDYLSNWGPNQPLKEVLQVLHQVDHLVLLDQLGQLDQLVLLVQQEEQQLTALLVQLLLPVQV